MVFVELIIPLIELFVKIWSVVENVIIVSMLIHVYKQTQMIVCSLLHVY